MTYLDGVRIRALAGVMDPDSDYNLRFIKRWYSREFCTPLEAVDDIPLDDLLLNYYECEYEKLKDLEDGDDQLHNLAIFLLETPEERAVRAEADSKSEDDFIKQAHAQNAQRQKEKLGGLNTKVEALLKRMREADDTKMGDGLRKVEKQRGDRPMVDKPMLKDVALDGTTTINYMSEADFDAELDKVTGPAPKPKKLKKS